MALRIRTNFEHQVEVLETVWIPLADGARLAARIWLPVGVETSPVPAILEYVPYRRRDYTRLWDEPMHAYFAGHGYATIRVDLRGAGDSDGLLADEYLPQEQNDAVEVISWIAAQPWCTGRVGMMGISWGGFNSLQVAALRPPALKAIITSCSTDDRYNDDIHYMGGCVLGDNFSWSSTLFGRVSPPPPDPEVVGDGWREMWMKRLEATPMLLETWLSHQRRDAYWKHGSVCGDYGAIQCPVFAIGGWNDGYQNAIPRLLAGLKVPRLGLIGAWSHFYGFEDGGPGPMVGILQEFLRWWDHWLKDRETGIMTEPMLRAYMMDSERPAARVENWPGRWIAEKIWPVSDGGIQMETFSLNDRGVLDKQQERGSRPMSIRSPLQIGFAAGEWCRHDTGTDLATDQRVEDAGSLCFDGEPLAERLEFLGAPVATLMFSVDRPVAQAVVRLNDIHPDGAVTRISWGVKNLCHLHDQENPVALESGRLYTVTFKLNDTAYSVLPGHRLRVAISTNYFPIVWPAPEPFTLTLIPGTSSIALPLRQPRLDDSSVEFGQPEAAPPGPATTLEAGSMRQTAHFDAGTGRWELEIIADGGRERIEEIDLLTGSWRREAWSVHPDDPTSAAGEITSRYERSRGDWTILHKAHCTMTIARDHYRIHADLDAYENGERVFARSITKKVPRDHT
ncbi:hypothetical protein X768_22940 [Mesorhizobium sp. LSJC265A00]|uniref:CocE/NonD family hydrolase n=1 Tax=Mesorhizobium sp. LSJC265A00 TaxID=1287322 RepID=UPI0003CF85B6|nr:CocE/NonD family hydrolase [Mesorhizobium sp. LSJC265A00]ESX08325.1 hypothetical protein X768_22940 [Mesorhizobium sp. LSJC265A00]